jgi:hypothetical protein
MQRERDGQKQRQAETEERQTFSSLPCSLAWTSASLPPTCTPPMKERERERERSKTDEEFQAYGSGFRVMYIHIYIYIYTCLRMY